MRQTLFLSHPADITPKKFPHIHAETIAIQLIQQIASLNAQRGRQLLHNTNGWIACSAFQVANVGPVNASLERKLLLT